MAKLKRRSRRRLEGAVSTRVTGKGQVAIPRWVRDHLNLKPDSAVDFELAEDGRVVLVKAGRKSAGRSVFARIRGAATVRMTTEEIMALTRGEV